MPAPPLVREIAWLEPVEAYAALADLPAPALLESARVDGRLGRFSYSAADPFHLLTSKDGRITCDGRSRTFTGDPFAALQRLLRAYPIEVRPDLPPFQGGAMGYLGYDLCHHLERLPYPGTDDMAFPDLALGFYDVVVAFDHASHRTFLLSSGHPEPTPHARMSHQRARLEQFQRLLDGALALSEAPPQPADVPILSNFTCPAYEAAVARVVEYILAGDIFQANISQRFQAEPPDGVDALA